jgi:hypothetical protein
VNGTRFRVVFSGAVQAGLTHDQVKERLATMYRLPMEKVEPYFTGGPVVLRKGLDHSSAEKTHRAFTSAGAIVRIEPESPAVEPAATPVAHTPPRPDESVGAVATTQRIRTTQCPKCGLTQPESESCLQCGVIFSKVHEAPTQPTDETSEPAAPPAAPDAVTEDEPHLFTDTMEIVPLLVTSVTMGILNFLLVGILLSPRMGWNFLVRHVNVNGERLKNEDLWLGLRPMLWIPLGIATMFVLAFPLGLVMMGLSTISEALAQDVGRLIAIPLLAFAAAPLQLGVLHSLTLKTTTTSGDVAFRQLFPISPAGFWSFIRQQRRQYWMAGWAFMAFLFFFTAPVGFAIMMTLFFNQLEIDERRFTVDMPWKKSLIWSALCMPTLGIASLFFVLWYFNEHLSTGRWRRVSAQELGESRNPDDHEHEETTAEPQKTPQ